MHTQGMFSPPASRAAGWILAGMALLAGAPGISWAQPRAGLAAGIFEIDGDLVGDLPDRVDWFGGPAASLSGVIDPDSCRGDFLHLTGFSDATFYRDDHWAASAIDLSTFAGGGNKNNDCIDAAVDPWSTGAGSGPGKSDITEAYSAAYRDPATGDNWLLLAFATRSTNGDSEMDFEFNAAGLNLNPSTGSLAGNGSACGRTLGDFIVSINFVGGRSTPQPVVLQWDGTSYVPIGTTAGAENFLVAVNNGVVAAPCGAVSPDGQLVTEYIPLQFAEIAINLSGVGIDLADFCGKPSATLSFKTRSSASFTAALKDFKLFPFQLIPGAHSSIEGGVLLCADGVTQLCGPETDQAGNPLSYRWSTGEASRCITLSGAALGPGQHPVSLVVANLFGCTDSSAVQLTVVPEIVVSVADVAVCAGETGRLETAVSGGTGPYTYAWSTGSTESWIAATTAGEYCVTVRDANGCEARACGTLTVHALPEVSVGDAALCAGETGRLEAEVSGGTGPYTYAWSTGSTESWIAATTAGGYCVTVRDANGCEARACGTLTVHALPEVSVGDAAVCAGETGQLEAVVSGGTGPYTYEWSTGAAASSLEVSTAGEYCVTVQDANGCEARACGTLVVHALPEVSVGDVAVCAGETGRLDAVVSGGTGSYTYAWTSESTSWSLGATESWITASAAGEYCVTVRDASGCEARACGTLVVHALPEVSVGDAAVCAGETGRLEAVVSGGTGPYTYEWSTGSTASSLEVSTAGEYCVTVRDENGCEARACGTLVVHALPEVSVADAAVCAGETGRLVAVVANGTGPYTYAWSSESTSWSLGSTESWITATVAGEYCVTVRDANGCEGRVCGTLTVHPALEVSVGDVAVCAGETGRLEAEVSGGSGPYTYAWSTGSTESSLEVPTAGEYCVTVRDANGCESRACGTLVVHGQPEASVGDASVCAGETARLEAEVSGGTGPYTYAWSSESTSWSLGSTESWIRATQAGEYCVTVRDANGCESRACGTLTVHPALEVSLGDVVVCAGETGRLEVVVSGGTGPYTYAWSTGSTASSLEVSTAGEYCVTVRDANGCEGRACGTLTVRQELAVSVGSVGACAGEMGRLEAVVSNGSGPYTYTWSTGSTESSLEVSTAGEYCVTVRDANGCEGRACGTLTVHPALEVSVGDAAVCSGETGRLEAVVANGTAPYTYAWSSDSTSWSLGSTESWIRATQSGEYCVTVRDANGCEGRACGTLTVHPALEVSVADATVCAGESGRLEAVVTNGTGPYTYKWSTGSTESWITVTTEGEYCVTVRDANSCEGHACGRLILPSTPVCAIQGPALVCMSADNVYTFSYVPQAVPAKADVQALGGLPGSPSLRTPVVEAAGPQVSGGALDAALWQGIPVVRASRGTPLVKSGGEGIAAGGFSWSVDDPSHCEIVGPSDQADVAIRFNGPGTFTVTLQMTYGVGCTNACAVDVVVLDCSAANCPRTVGFWGRQCDQNSSGSTKFSMEDMQRIVECVDARSEALRFGSGAAGFAAFCTVIRTDDMDPRHQAERQFAGLLANVCATNLGLAAVNGDFVRLIEFTEIDCGGFSATTIAGLIEEIDALLVVLAGRDLGDPDVRNAYSRIISCADGINNGIGVGAVCPDGPKIDEELLPPTLSMSKASPNPFSGNTRVAYAVSGTSPQPVDIVVYDVAGRRVKVLARGVATPGTHLVTWDGRDTHGTPVARGVYYIRGRVSGNQFTTGVILLR